MEGVCDAERKERQESTSVRRRAEGRSGPDVAGRAFSGVGGVSSWTQREQRSLSLEGEAAVGKRTCGDGVGGASAGAGEGTAPRGAGARHPKKSIGHFQPENVEQVYAVIGHLQQDGFPAATLCEVFEVHRSGYYA